VDASGGDSKTGYLYVSRDYRWPADPLADGRLPDAWLTTDSATDQVDILDSKRKYLPDRVRVAPDGTIAEGDLGMVAWFISTPFAFCLRCGVSYEQVRGQDFGKLATLDSEGRSSAVSLLSASIIRALSALPESELPLEARKLLTFVDNRQDASLQAGHLNDFVQVSQLRAALFSALKAKGDQGLAHDEIAAAVTSALGLSSRDFAASPEAKFGARQDAERALRAIVEYQLFVDIQRLEPDHPLRAPGVRPCGLGDRVPAHPRGRRGARGALRSAGAVRGCDRELLPAVGRGPQGAAAGLAGRPRHRDRPHRVRVVARDAGRPTGPRRLAGRRLSFRAR